MRNDFQLAIIGYCGEEYLLPSAVDDNQVMISVSVKYSGVHPVIVRARGSRGWCGVTSVITRPWRAAGAGIIRNVATSGASGAGHQDQPLTLSHFGLLWISWDMPWHRIRFIYSYFVSYTIMIVSLHSMPVHNEMDFRPQLNIYTNSNKP